jgi:uncharacterized membrane protein YgaE (UPF0421/DUF939 family)
MEGFMSSRDKLIRLRIIHITLMFMTALFIYQFVLWEDALWIPITVVAIIGPFRPGYSIDKAKQRILGSIAGLLLSLIISVFLHYNYYLLSITAVVLIYFTAFTALLQYRYFIMMVTIMLCINFNFINLAINSETTYLVNRFICVFTGIFICQFFEYFIFKRYYSNAVCLVGKEDIEEMLNDTTKKFEVLKKDKKANLDDLTRCIEPLSVKLSELNELKESSLSGYSDQSQTLRLIDYYIKKINSTIRYISSSAFSLLGSQDNTKMV